MSELKFKPYARLLTMLGDQLIKNERVALVEVIKNSYDADATWVTVRFENFLPDFTGTSDSQIVIEDNGFGMTEETITQHWINPATPQKYLRKKLQPKTPGGRVIQGEKGIGRFALLKLGRKIEVCTRPKGAKQEFQLTLDLSKFDDDFIEDDGKKQKALFLDDLNIDFDRTPTAKQIVDDEISLGGRKVQREPHGTRIVISHLKTSWSRAKVEDVFDDLTRLQTIFDVAKTTPKEDVPAEGPLPFEVLIYRDEQYEHFARRVQDRFEWLIKEASVLKVEDGSFNPSDVTFRFKQDGAPKHLSLKDPDVTGLAVFRKYFGKNAELFDSRSLDCGPFSFTFYAFDFSSEATGKFALDADDKLLVREHRIYLYRDGIRVYPYGDPKDDWLGIDIYRGTVRASEFLSNDQVLGYVTITQQDNPKLRDKTSREGLIDVGHATADFVAVLQVFLAWMRKRPFEAYRQRVREKVDIDIFKKEKVVTALNEAWDLAKEHAPKDVQEKLIKAAQLYKAERSYLVQRAETTEHLAGVGLSVETASHDVMTAMHQVLRVVDTLIVETKRAGVLDKPTVGRELTMVRGSLSFIETQLKDIQLLFKSSKQRRKDIRVSEMLEKVVRLFEPTLRRSGIDIDIQRSKEPLVAKTTEAVLLQVLLNLFDNAVYWLESKEGKKTISIELNGETGQLKFADDGPGIRSDDEPYVFDAFYSGKGEEGRGLGLYIARQLLERHDYEISLVTKPSEKLLPGANFSITFIAE
jgi:signal transduction histidine kinase